MPTVIDTPGASNANSYISVAFADDYHTTHLYASAWTGATTTVKETAVIMATRLMDAMWEWDRWPVTATQALAWPRNGMEDFNQLRFVADNEIPTKLKQATAELARQLIESNTTETLEQIAQGLTSLKAGPISLTFKEFFQATVIPDAVVNLIPRWWGYLKGRFRGSREIVRT